MGKWRRTGSLGFIVHRRGRSPSVLVRSTVEKGTFQRPPFLDLSDWPGIDLGIPERLEELKLGIEDPRPVPMGMKMTFFIKETRIDEHLYTLEAPEDLLAPSGYRWVTPREAFDSFLLSGHKRGVATVFPELLPGGLSSLDHVPVKAPSGIVIICDFDGTVSDPEASLAILRRFAPGKWERYERPWLDKEITTHECLGYQFTLLEAPAEEMARFAADTIKLRDGFGELADYCKRSGHGLVITSCGVDFYIRAILERHGLGDVPFVAIRTHWVDGIGHIAEEGLFNAGCDFCGNCKVDLIKMYKARGDKVIYIGDGATDECAAVKADQIFARAWLLEHCKKEKLPCLPFETFVEILKWLERA